MTGNELIHRGFAACGEEVIVIDHDHRTGGEPFVERSEDDKNRLVEIEIT